VSYEEDMIEAALLERFRADPRRVRVSIARGPKGWRATVAARGEDGPTVIRSARTPRMATMLALRAADGSVPGIDLWMQWTYRHPFRMRADAVRDAGLARMSAR
jgi:hypothetical protein